MQSSASNGGSSDGVVAVVRARDAFACGVTSEAAKVGDAGLHDALGDGPSDSDSVVTDAPDDAPGYLACMSESGQLDGSLKSCQSDADCTLKQEETDCCGTTLYVGVSKVSAAKFDACETAWTAHFPGCGCASNQTSTEDGKTSRLGADGGAPRVHCIDFTMNGDVCMTYTP
jgi:hypothetical protein